MKKYRVSWYDGFSISATMVKREYIETAAGVETVREWAINNMPVGAVDVNILCVAW